MEMYKELMEYYDSKELSELQNEWEKHESHEYDSGGYVDELFDFWDEIYPRPGDKILKEPEKINISNFSAPKITEHFFYNKYNYGYRTQSSFLPEGIRNFEIHF